MPPAGIQSVLLIFGIAGMIVGSVSAIRSKRLTTMDAYSSAAQIGYIYMGLGMGTQAALLAAFLHIFSHALTKPMLFLSASGLRDVSGGHNDFPSLQGAGHRNVAAGVLFTAGALSMVGVPLFIGFIPKLQFAQAAFALTWEKWPVLLALAVSTLLNVLYFLYTAMVLWLPQKDGTMAPAQKINWGKAHPPPAGAAGHRTCHRYPFRAADGAAAAGLRPVLPVLRKGVDCIICYI